MVRTVPVHRGVDIGRGRGRLGCRGSGDAWLSSEPAHRPTSTRNRYIPTLRSGSNRGHSVTDRVDDSDDPPEPPAGRRFGFAVSGLPGEGP